MDLNNALKDISPSSLTSGVGFNVCQVLNILLDHIIMKKQQANNCEVIIRARTDVNHPPFKALDFMNNSWGKLQYEEAIHDGCYNNGKFIAKDDIVCDLYIDNQELTKTKNEMKNDTTLFHDADGMSLFSIINNLEDVEDDKDRSTANNRSIQIMYSHVTLSEWERECRKVSSILTGELEKVAKDRNHCEWKANLNAMKTHSQYISSSCPHVKEGISRLLKHINYDLTELRKIQSMTIEQIMCSSNSSAFTLHQKINISSLEQNAIVISQIESNIISLSTKLGAIADANDKVKRRVEKWHKKMNDDAPLHKIRQSVKVLKDEVCTLDLRIGYIISKLLRINSNSDDIGEVDIVNNNKLYDDDE